MRIQVKERKPICRDKEEVRLENPVIQLLKNYGVKTKGNRFMPFCHQSNELSGTINNQTCYCHVCGVTFDCFGVVGYFEGIDNLYEQVLFLGGEDLSEDNDKRKEQKAKAQQLKEARELEEKAKKDLVKDIVEKTDRMYELRTFLRNNKPTQGNWPSKEWAEAYSQLQTLDCQVSDLLGDNTGGDMNCFPDIALC